MKSQRVSKELAYRDSQDLYGHLGQEVSLEEWLQSNYQGDTFLKRRLGIVLIFAKSLPRNSAYLEIGCGSGDALTYLMANISEPESRVFYSDISLEFMSKSISVSRKFFGLEEDNFVTIAFSAEKMPFDDCQFDLIIAKSAVHHFDNPTEAFSEIYRVLKPNGVFFFMNDPQKGFLYHFGSAQKIASKLHQKEGINCRVYSHRKYISFCRFSQIESHLDPSFETELAAVMKQKKKTTRSVVALLMKSEAGKRLLSRKLKLPLIYTLTKR
jgi:ubiquinone/menaquinone biosynthesis C-methylase UbiE